MKKKNNKHWFLYLITFIQILIVSCNRTERQGIHSKKLNSNYNSNFTVEQLKEKLLGNPISKINYLNGCFSVRDTLIYEDDRVFWRGKSVYLNKRFILLAETNWKDTIHISRLTIVGDFFKTASGIRIGSSLKSMKNFIIRNAAPNPDGFLSFKDKHDPSISYYMDVSKYPDLANGKINNANEMPSEIIVSSITVNKR